MKDLFCIIEEDEKTFTLLSRYINECHDESDVMVIDNMVQLVEIQQHIINNCIPEDHKDDEALNWVMENASGFRIYINTIKILWSAHMLIKGTAAALTFEEFHAMKQNFNTVKPVLSTIRF
jgi:hypothetical protein